MGRRRGAKNIAHVYVEVNPSRCPVCHSTKRAPYDRAPHVVESSGMHDGRPYNRVVFRYTKCLVCGQARCDKHYEYD